MTRFRRLISDESGNFMISSLVGSIVMTVVVGAIAAGILGIALYQKAITERSAVTNEAAIADSTLRTDILWASSVKAIDHNEVELTVPGQDGRCRTATWTISPGVEAKTAVNVTVTNYPTTDADANPVRCSGEAGSPSTQTIIADADPESSFSYSNAGGREMTFSSGVPILEGPDNAPSGIQPKTWGSTKLAAIALNTAVASSSEQKTVYRFAQSADNLSVTQEVADAPSHFVPEGDLTALP